MGGRPSTPRQAPRSLPIPLDALDHLLGDLHLPVRHQDRSAGADHSEHHAVRKVGGGGPVRHGSKHDYGCAFALDAAQDGANLWDGGSCVCCATFLVHDLDYTKVDTSSRFRYASIVFLWKLRSGFAGSSVSGRVSESSARKSIILRN
jgi:hypothetical protein